MEIRDFIYIDDIKYSKLNISDLSQSEKNIYHKIDLFLSEWWSDSNSVIVKTSGSTGNPKTISLEKKFIIQSAINTCKFFNLNQKSSAIFCLNPEFIAGKMMIVRALISGMKLYTSEDLSKPLNGFAIENFDFVAMVPSQLYPYSEDFKKLAIVKNILLGGSSFPESLNKIILNCQSNVYLSYGMTETASHVALRKLNHGASEIYTAIGDFTFSTDENNCLEINGNNFRLITKDIVQIIDNKNFKWLGRLDNVINSGGIKIYPELIEAKLEPLIPFPFFIEGVAHEKYGKVPRIVIEDCNLEEFNNLSASAKKVLEKYEFPKFIRTVNLIQFTQTGKLIRDV